MAQNVKTVLIADDTPDIAQVVKVLVENYGYHAVTAEDGRQAVQKAVELKPDLIFLDVMMPEMHGIEALTEIRKKCPDIPVVMLSVVNDPLTTSQARRLGAFAYITKPFRIEDVTAVIDRVMRHQLASRGIWSGPGRMWRSVREWAGPRAVKLIFGLAAVAVLAGIWRELPSPRSLWMRVSAKPALQEFALPYQNPVAICFSNDKTAWIADWVTGSVNKHKVDRNLSLRGSHPVPGGHPTGIAWDGIALWSCNSWERKIYRHNLDDSLSVSASYASPAPEPSGLFWEGEILWVCDAREGRIYRLKLKGQEFELVDSYKYPSGSPVGVFVTVDAVWTADSETNLIYQHAKDRALTAVRAFSIPVLKEKGLDLSGFTLDGEDIWILADNHARVYKTWIRHLVERDL